MTDDSKPSYTLALAICFIILCPICVGLRFYARTKNKHTRYGIDDWLVVAALPWVIGCCVLLLIGVRTKALAYPSDHLSPVDASNLYHIRQKLQYVYFIFHPVAMGCVKNSFVFLYRRIFVIGSNRSFFGIISIATIALIACWAIAFTLSWIFQCDKSPSQFWSNHTVATEHCTYIYQWSLGYAISDLVTDIWVLALPIPLVLRLHMKLRRKIAVIGMFALGLVALAASTTRLAIFNYLLKIGFDLEADPTFDLALTLTRIHYWATLEVGLAFVACNLPTLGALAGVRGVKSIVASITSLQSIRSGNTISSDRRPSAHHLSRDTSDDGLVSTVLTTEQSQAVGKNDRE